MHVYEVRPRKNHRVFDVISDAQPFGRWWYTQVSHAIGYTKFYSCSHDMVIRVYDAACNVIETHEHKGISKNGEASHVAKIATEIQFLQLTIPPTGATLLLSEPELSLLLPRTAARIHG